MGSIFIRFLFATALAFSPWPVDSVTQASISPGQASQASSTEAAITDLLTRQTAAWNRGELEGFMAGYWKSDKTEFVGASGITRGWETVLEHYRKGYPDRKAMGELRFSILDIHALAPNAAYVLGTYHLEREKGSQEGVFTLILRKFPEGWRIVHDHTTAYPRTSP